MKHILLIASVIVIIVAGMFLPYIHGDYDYFAAGLSALIQLAAFASLLLVPTGVAWCIMDLVQGKNHGIMKHPFYFRKISLVITAIIILAAVLGALAHQSVSLAIVVSGFGVYILVCIGKHIKKDLTPANSIRYHILPYYFIFIPLTVVFIRITFLEEAKNRSTDFVIKRSQQLIQDIEAYKVTNGYYPVSLQSTIDDYKPSVSGIQRFHYERSSNAYNLYFEQFSDAFGTQEIIMYNQLDEHEMTVHNQDLLRIAPGNIIRGYHRVIEHPQRHWKIFYFD